MNKIKLITMYLSTYIPVVFLILIKDLLHVINDLSHGITVKYGQYIPMIIMSLLWIVILITFCKLIKNNKEIADCTIQLDKVENKSSQFYIEYFSMFVIGLMGFSFLDYITTIIFVLLVVMLGFMYIRNDLYYMNPTFSLFKRYIYVVDYMEDNILRTNRIVITNNKLKKNQILDVYISNYDFTFEKVNKDESNN